MKPESAEEMAIKELICNDCEGYSAHCFDCDAFAIATVAVEVFGESFLEKWDGSLPPQVKKQEELLHGLQALAVLKKISAGILEFKK